MPMQHPRRRFWRPRLSCRLEWAIVMLGRWRRRHLTRRALRELDARRLADIGRTEAERRRECAKWFWQA
jgi:uncharacterized protein YjiS (DUF1127 family)